MIKYSIILLRYSMQFVLLSSVHVVLIAQNPMPGVDLKKNMIYTGLLLSYSNQKKANVKTAFENSIANNEKQGSLKIGGGYFFQNRMAAGIGFNIANSNTNKEVKNVIGANTITTSKTREFGFSPYLRNYFGLDKNHHFYLYTQTGLVFSSEKGKETTTTGLNVTNTDISKSNYGISFTPGIMAFIEKGFAFEVNVGVGGINSSYEKRKTPGQPESTIRSTNVDLNINILKLNLGLAYYF